MFLSDIGKIKERGMLMFMARSYIDLLGSISDMSQGLLPLSHSSFEIIVRMCLFLLFNKREI